MKWCFTHQLRKHRIRWVYVITVKSCQIDAFVAGQKYFCRWFDFKVSMNSGLGCHLPPLSPLEFSWQAGPNACMGLTKYRCPPPKGAVGLNSWGQILRNSLARHMSSDPGDFPAGSVNQTRAHQSPRIQPTQSWMICSSGLSSCQWLHLNCQEKDMPAELHRIAAHYLRHFETERMEKDVHIW